MWIFTAGAVILISQALSVHCYCNNAFGDGLYYVSDDLLTWYQAKEACALRNMNLVSICSVAERNQIYQYIRTCGTITEYWTGLTDLGLKNSWIYQSNGLREDFIYWDDGQPNNLNGVENCVAVKTTSGQLRGNDFFCENTVGYICKARTC